MDEGRPRTPTERPLLPKHRDHLITAVSNQHDRGRAGHRTHTSPAPSMVPPAIERRSTMRSRSPAAGAHLAARRKYTYAAFFLVVSLVSFTIQTELAKYIQQDLGWNKAYCMLYLTHGSWALLWPAQLLVLRLQKRRQPWQSFWRRHVWLLRTTAQMVERQDLDVPRAYQAASPVPYLLRMTAVITLALTVAGLSWYIAVDLTTPSDLTAIYNCSAFFAYAFSVPLLKERLRLDKSLAVVVAIAGVLVVAYGDSRNDDGAGPSSEEGAPLGIEADAFLGSSAPAADAERSRLAGNLIIGVGSVLYGLYEVLYKRYACPPDGCSPGRGMIFANAFGSLIGSFTLLVLWIPLPVLHILGIETFELPTGSTAWYLFLSVIMNASFAGSFLVLISLTSPVLSSVAALLTIFIVAVSDWIITEKPPGAAAVLGGLMIIIAFAMLSWSTWREMTESEKHKGVDLSDSEDDNDSAEDP